MLEDRHAASVDVKIEKNSFQNESFSARSRVSSRHRSANRVERSRISCQDGVGTALTSPRAALTP